MFDCHQIFFDMISMILLHGSERKKVGGYGSMQWIYSKRYRPRSAIQNSRPAAMRRAQLLSKAQSQSERFPFPVLDYFVQY